MGRNAETSSPFLIINLVLKKWEKIVSETECLSNNDSGISKSIRTELSGLEKQNRPSHERSPDPSQPRAHSRTPRQWTSGQACARPPRKVVESPPAGLSLL